MPMSTFFDTKEFKQALLYGKNRITTVDEIPIDKVRTAVLKKYDPTRPAELPEIVASVLQDLKCS